MGAVSPTQGATGRFEVGHAIAVARGLMKGTKRHVLVTGLLVAVAEFVVGRLWGPDASAGGPASWWYHLVMGVVSGAALLAYASLGLAVAAGERLSASRAFRELHRLPAVLLVTLPLSLLFMYLHGASGAGWWLLLGLVAVPMGFWPLYLVDRDLDPVRAIARSFALVFANLGGYLRYVLLSALLGGLVGLTLGVAVIWVLPFLVIAPAVMFAMAEGLQADYGS